MQTTQTRPTETQAPTREAGADGHPNGHPADHDEIDINVPPARPVWVGVAGAVVVILLVALLLIGLIPRRAQERELHETAQAAIDAPVPVNVTTPRRAPRVVDITLPGNMRPWQEVSIFARTSGYLKNYYVDISNTVEKGQLMAELDTPEVEQELAVANASVLQAKAAAAKALADRDLARVTWERYKPLVEQKHISVQEYDEKQADLRTRT